MRNVAIVQARMGSTRLPGKILMPATGKPLLVHMIDRVNQCKMVDEIVVATPGQPDDIAIYHALRAAGHHNYFAWAGGEDDVLSRVLVAARAYQADTIIELTADCPLIDPEIIDETASLFAVGDFAFCSNATVRSYPDGMDVSVFSLDTLEQVSLETTDPYDREHVSTHIRRNRDRFPAFDLIAPPDLAWPELGLTLDEPADYELIRRIVEHFAPAIDYTLADIMDLLRNKPEWVALNEQVSRNPVH